jgi:hypothetical protein
MRSAEPSTKLMLSGSRKAWATETVVSSASPPCPE